MERLYKILDKVRAALIIALLSGVVLLCVVQIILRYFTPAELRPFSWGDEVVRLTAIWVVFLAASIGVKMDSHLSVEFFLHKILGPRHIAIAKKAATLIVILVLGAVFIQGIKYTSSSTRTMMQNLTMVSMAWFYAAIPVGCFFLMIEYGRKLFGKE